MPTATRKRRSPPSPVALHVLLYPEDGLVLAHALETDVVSQGDTADEAFRNVEEALALLFDAVAADPDARSPFETPAPAAYWRALRGAGLGSSSQLRLRGCGAATLLAHRLDESPVS